LEAWRSSATLIVLGILTWILISILLQIYLARAHRLKRLSASEQFGKVVLAIE